MSREVDLSNRPAFFPSNKSSKQERTGGAQKVGVSRNSSERTQQLKGRTAGDAKVEISDAIKDFSRIKKAVDAAPEIDNSSKIAKLKAQIARGEYQIDYDAVADRMLQNEF